MTNLTNDEHTESWSHFVLFAGENELKMYSAGPTETGHAAFCSPSLDGEQAACWYFTHYRPATTARERDIEKLASFNPGRIGDFQSRSLTSFELSTHSEAMSSCNILYNVASTPLLSQLKSALSNSAIKRSKTSLF